MKLYSPDDQELERICPYRNDICGEPDCEGTVPVASTVVPFGGLGLMMTLKMCPFDPRYRDAALHMQTNLDARIASSE